MRFTIYFTLLTAAMTILYAGNAHPHDWYETRCCSGGDCQPAPVGSVELTDGGWFVHRGIRNPNGEVLQKDDFIAFNDNRIKPMPPRADHDRGTGMHICTNRLRVICVYIDSGF